MRILILAEDCNPDTPSLPVVGYKFAKAIADHADVVVATQIRNKESIDKAGLGKAEVVYIDTETLAAPLYRIAVFLRGGNKVGWTLQMAMNYPSYVFFEWKVWHHFKEQLLAGHFDIVHRITPMTPTIPSPIASQSPVPFVLGPLNGNLPWPKFYAREKSREKEWLSNLRNTYKLLPYYRSTYAKAASILAAFDHTIADLPDVVKHKIINYPEVGVDPDIFSIREISFREKAPDEPMTILFVGRLVPYKLPEVVVRAFVNSKILQKHRLKIVGEGPERQRLEQILIGHDKQLSCVEFTGKIPQPEVGRLMQEADIFAFPSIRELGAGAVLEAMACGMACVVVDYGGPATLINGDRGVKVPMANLSDLVTFFQAELENLVSNPERVKALGEKAQDHAMRHYTWQAKAESMVNIYNWVLGKEKCKPSFLDR